MKPSITLLLSLLIACGHSGAYRPPTATTQPDIETPTPEETATPELIQVRVLLITYQGARGASPEQTRTKQQALARAQLMQQMARAGDPMSALVPEYSERPLAGSDMGLFKLRTAEPTPFGPEVIEAALALDVNGISPPIETPEGYLVIDRRPDPATGPTEISARHILIAYLGSPQAVGNATRSESEARARAEEAMTKARQPDADWNALAAEYTDEPGSDQTGGDLGHFGRGRMVPAFERAAFKLQVNEISDVVQSPFGFHVIQRYE